MVKRLEWRLLIVIGMLVPPAIFLGHGYDLIVGYVAAKNILDGRSPYEGGKFNNPSYPQEVQGIGETPLWPLYLSASLIISGGDLNSFNALSKVPILLSILLTYKVLRGLGVKGATFYLYNPYVVLTTVAWGKPDSVAALLFLIALLGLKRQNLSALLLALSLNIKPIALGAVPALAAYLGPKRSIMFLAKVALASLAVFSMPFLILRWNLGVPLEGSINWLSEAGGLSPLNLLEYFYGWNGGNINPFGPIVGVPWLVTTTLISFLTLIKPPRSFKQLLWYALLSNTAFLVLRPRVSEQNLILPFVILHLTTGSPPTLKLWATVLSFMVLNLSIPQLLYPVWPSVVIEVYHATWELEGIRLIGRFATSIAFYYFYFAELIKVRRIVCSDDGFGSR